MVKWRPESRTGSPRKAEDGPTWSASARLTLQTLVLVQQHALGFLRVHRTVVQLVFLEEDLDESRPRGNEALDQRFRQGIFDVLLQGTPQRTRAIAAIAECLIEDPLLGLGGYGHGD